MIEDTDFFIRTEKDFAANSADHNVLRCLWIGKGKAFSQINEIGSTYREFGVKRENFNSQATPIEVDLKYDIEKGLIAWYSKRDL